MAKWSAQHYNAIAKEIRELFPIEPHPEMPTESPEWAELRKEELTQRHTLAVLAINLAKRFEQDSERFQPLRFLNACSPNTDLYPLSELWEG